MTITDLISDVNSALVERGLDARAVLSVRRRTVRLRHTPFVWGIDAYPLLVLRAEIDAAIDILAEANPLEAYRKRHRLSYGELGRRLGLQAGTVNAYCRNIISPSKTRRRAIEAATDGEVPVTARWPLPPREAHRPADPEGRRERGAATLPAAAGHNT